MVCAKQVEPAVVLMQWGGGGSGLQKAPRLLCPTLCLHTPAAKLLLPAWTRRTAALTPGDVDPMERHRGSFPWLLTRGHLAHSLPQPFCSPALDQGLRRARRMPLDMEREEGSPSPGHSLPALQSRGSGGKCPQ